MSRHKVLTGMALVTGMTLASSALGARLRTAPIVPSVDQKLVCTVVNVSGKPLAITATLIDRWGENVTCFIRTDWDASYTVLLTVRAEAIDPEARYCRVTVRGGRKADVRASLQACTLDDSVCGSPVEAR
jgi:hypothetical protein